jgi:ectoine hydroxylase-related dioxygenase (phytanoyl-CoA dioxygenase family)
VFERVPVHATLLPIVEGVIGEGCLISSLSSIAIDPGEVAQPIHADDQLIPLDKPHRPIICNSMWALTDFTEASATPIPVPISPTRHRITSAKIVSGGRDGSQRARVARSLWHCREKNIHRRRSHSR